MASRPLDLGDPAGFRAPRLLDVLVPTRDRATELAATLAGLAGQRTPAGFGVAVSDQSDGAPPWMNRPAEQAAYRPWTGPVVPEDVCPGSPQWGRHRVHNAANLLHLAESLGFDDRDPAGPWQAYRVAWIGACVLYDRARLLACGGFDFWADLPAGHAGEDVAAQLAVARRYGGAGILPSGAYHLESPTTVPDRDVQCHELLAAGPPTAGAAPPDG